MDLTLVRKEKNEFGIFGLIPELEVVTLEHAYKALWGSCIYRPKIEEGIYHCIRGLHRLARMIHDFETFEIIVPGHTDILFHVGNINNDSEGCVLLGTSNYKDEEITGSKIAFDLFMRAQIGIDSFKLTVDDS